MSENEKKSLKERFIFPIILCIVGAFVAAIAKDHYVDIWNWVISYLKVFWNWISGAYSVPRWLVFVSVFFLAKAFVKRVKQFLRTELAEAPNYYSYKEDIFFDAVWRWRYERGKICSLLSYCPKCDMNLMHGGDPILRTTKLSCDNCHFHTGEYPGNYAHMINRVENHIARKIRNDEWQVINEQDRKVLQSKIY